MRATRRSSPVNPKAQPSLLKKLFSTVVMTGALAGLSWLGWMAYQENHRPRTLAALPMIRAEEGPFKVKPADPGGMQFPEKDRLVFNTISGDASRITESRTTLVNDTEEPVERAFVKDKLLGPILKPKQLGEISPAAGPAAEPVSVPSFTANPDKEENIIRLVSIPDLPATLPEVPEDTVNSEEQKRREIVGGYRVQLGAYRSTEALEKGWAALKKRFPDQLDGLTYVVNKADLGAKGTFYRIHAGPVDGESGARRLCLELIAEKQGCFIVKPKS